MRLTILFSLLLISVFSGAQVEVPNYTGECKLVQKNNFTYCIDAKLYEVKWAAGKYYKTDIENRTYIPPDADFFPDLAKTGSYLWANLEKQVKLWAMEYDSLYVVTGKIKSEPDSTTLDSIPRIIYYKAILKGCQGDAIGFLIDPLNDKGKLEDYVVTIDKVESATDMDFFPTLNKDLQDIIESNVNLEFWPISF